MWFYRLGQFVKNETSGAEYTLLSNGNFEQHALVFFSFFFFFFSFVPRDRTQKSGREPPRPRYSVPLHTNACYTIPPIAGPIFRPIFSSGALQTLPAVPCGSSSRLGFRKRKLPQQRHFLPFR